MAIAKESFGTMPDGTEVYRYTLINKNKVSASFITLGGVWVSMVVPDKDGIPGDVVLGYDDLDSYRKNPPHFGAPVGRNANRIKGAVLTIGGKDYPLAANDGPTTFTAALTCIMTGYGSAVLLRQIKAAGWTFIWKARTGTRDIQATQRLR